MRLAYVAEESPEGASRLLLRVLEAGASLEVLSERRRMVPEMAQEAIREILVDPFRLLYVVRDSEVTILAVLHQRQDFTRWAEREFRRTDAL